MKNNFTYEHFMKEALIEATKAKEKNEIPIGAVIVENDKIIARGHNLVETLNDSTAHAEMIAMTSAFAYRNSKYIPDCTMFITLEPCIMCACATNWAHIKKIVFGAHDYQKGFTNLKDKIIHTRTEIVKGIMKIESENLLKDFFQKLRN